MEVLIEIINFRRSKRSALCQLLTDVPLPPKDAISSQTLGGDFRWLIRRTASTIHRGSDLRDKCDAALSAWRFLPIFENGYKGYKWRAREN